MSENQKVAYPARNIDDCVDSLKKAQDKTKKTTDTRQEFADGVDMTAAGGAYNVLVGSLSQFKLVETGNGQVVYTELGKKATFGREDEIRGAKSEAVRNVPLFTEIFKRFGKNPSEEQVRIYLKNDLAVDMSKLDSLTEKVRLSLKSNLQYMSLDDKQNDKEEQKGGEMVDMNDDDTVLGDAQAVIVSKIGRIKIVDEQSLAMARGYLPGLLGYIEGKLKEEKRINTREVQSPMEIEQ